MIPLYFDRPLFRIGPLIVDGDAILLSDYTADTLKCPVRSALSLRKARRQLDRGKCPRPTTGPRTQTWIRCIASFPACHQA